MFHWRNRCCSDQVYDLPRSQGTNAAADSELHLGYQKLELIQIYHFGPSSVMLSVLHWVSLSQPRLLGLSFLDISRPSADPVHHQHSEDESELCLCNSLCQTSNIHRLECCHVQCRSSSCKCHRVSCLLSLRSLSLLCQWFHAALLLAPILKAFYSGILLGRSSIAIILVLPDRRRAW